MHELHFTITTTTNNNIVITIIIINNILKSSTIKIIINPHQALITSTNRNLTNHIIIAAFGR